MSLFTNIEVELEKLSRELGAVISKDRPNYPESMRTFEERRIDWKDQGMNKAIIIQPTFERHGVNTELWNVRIVAWTRIERKRVSYFEELISKSAFSKIELEIIPLLKIGREKLENIKLKDLK